MSVAKNPWKIQLLGIGLFLFIPLVLFLFLQYPFGILPSIFTGIVIMFAHRFIAKPFLKRFHLSRCLWCGRTSRPREALNISTARDTTLTFQACQQGCLASSKRFFNFADKYKTLFRLGIFLPLVWYLVTMILIGLHQFAFPIEWNRFIFRFFIACTVVAVSFLYRTGREIENIQFRFPIHNLFLLGIKNTLYVFRFVGIWWIAISLYFLYVQNR
jgi:hypothetical protein